VALSKEQLHNLARLGAKARLEDLRAEMTAIEALVGASGRRDRKASRLADGRPKRRTISAAGRARIAAAQRKRWAAIKRAKSAKATSVARTQR
jgi:hypothetical protein